MAVKTVYYDDELNDDFGDVGIKVRDLRPGYRYVHHGLIWHIVEFVIFRFLAQPFVWLYMKVVWLHQYRNRRAIFRVKKTASGVRGFYVYSNHTQFLSDVFIPYSLRWRKKNHPVAGPALMSIRGINWLVQMLGAIPLPSNFTQMGEMRKYVFRCVRRGGIVTIYPEAHIWPYYTGIRPFRANSFHFPAEDGAPVFAVTNCYKKRPLGKKPRIVTFVDGPFYADPSLSLKQNMEKLRNECYGAMKKRATENSDYEYVHYEKRPVREQSDA